MTDEDQSDVISELKWLLDAQDPDPLDREEAILGAIDEIEQLREELEYQGECARIAEEVIEGTRLENEYHGRMREEGMYDD